MGIEGIRNAGFDCIYEANADLILRTAMRYSGNYYTAQEIMQNAFVKYYENIESVETGKEQKWLLKVASNLACNDYNKSKHEIAIEDNEFLQKLCGNDKGTDHVIFKKMHDEEVSEFLDKILKALEKRNTRWYDAVKLTCFYKMPQDEVAKTMGITTEAFYSMMNRIRNWVNKSYRDGYDELME